jgi:hypothetical protein
MAQELLREGGRRMAANAPAVTPRRSRNHPAGIAAVTGTEAVMAMPRVKRRLPVFAGLLAVMLSVRFGG